MAQQCAKIFEEACMPYQYALSTRAGTDCVARVVRLSTELDPKKTLLSIHGIGAFDHIKRKSTALYALGQHAALTHVDASLHEGGMLFAFLDDIYILCDPSRVSEIFSSMSNSRSPGWRVSKMNLGQTKVWNRAATRPEDLDTIGAEAWRDEGPEEEQGLVVLGVPVGHSAFV